jgi:hypothetical protein
MFLLLLGEQLLLLGLFAIPVYVNVYIAQVMHIRIYITCAMSWSIVFTFFMNITLFFGL